MDLPLLHSGCRTLIPCVGKLDVAVNYPPSYFFILETDAFYVVHFVITMQSSFSNELEGIGIYFLIFTNDFTMARYIIIATKNVNNISTSSKISYSVSMLSSP